MALSKLTTERNRELDRGPLLGERETVRILVGSILLFSSLLSPAFGHERMSPSRRSSCADQLQPPWKKFLMPLAQFMATPKMARSQPLQRFFELMKNEAGFREVVAAQPFFSDLETLTRFGTVQSRSRHRPKEVVLDLNDLTKVSPLLRSRLKSLPRTVAQPMSVYHEQLLSLENGDTVIFRTPSAERSFTVGRFLGAGDATYVWELNNRSNAVLRIPKGQIAHLDERHPSRFERASLREAIEQTRWLVERTISDRPSRGVRLLEIGPHLSYVIAERVKNGLTGRDFLLAFENRLAGFHLITLGFSQPSIQQVSDLLDYRAPWDEIAKGALVSDSELNLLVSRWKALLVLYNEVSDQEEIAGPRQFNLWERLQLLCNQVMWDPAKNQWIIVDW